MTATFSLSLADCLHSSGIETVEFPIPVSGKKVKLTLDRSFPTQEYIYRCISAGVYYEGESVEALADCLKPGDTFIDVGANCGYFTAVGGVMAGRKGKVISIEPMPDNFAALKLNSPQNVEVHQCVISDAHAESVSFFKNLDNDGGHALWNPAAHGFNKKTIAAGRVTREERAFPLDHWENSCPTAIKIDTEGAELRVLRGATQMLKQPQLKLVICERNDFGLAQMGDTPEEVISLMESNGFTAPPTAAGISNWIFKRL